MAAETQEEDVLHLLTRAGVLFLRVRYLIILATVIGLASPASAIDPDFFNGYWRGTNAARYFGTGPFLSIVSLNIARLPPRTPTDLEVRYSVVVRAEVTGDRPKVRIAPSPPLSAPSSRTDRRPSILPVTPFEMHAYEAHLNNRDPAAPFVVIRLLNDPLPGTAHTQECTTVINIDVVGSDVTYVVQRSRRWPCVRGPLAAITSYSRGDLIR